ncbi:MAG: molybdenum cofactor guanylyltransferase [Alphaproteobacteria bacterium HGW-Alphaproteobacteria-5]|jgi:molybdopterin-guanine dinucleotide biosynthesis protein A|nr:MAG: molybdenum cofactor guanylyltransferase [Alphaproteobacteria bacterium HGW-Alphaproteobacteria-5]
MASDVPLIVIAAGGDGARIGGGKPARMLGGLRLIDHAVAWASRHGDAVALAVRPGEGDWGTGCPLLFDDHRGIGPISALASAFAHARAQDRDSVLMIGCDMPFLPADLAIRLSAALGERGAALPSSGGRVHPAAALWRPDVPALAAYMGGGGQSLWGFAETVGMIEVAWDADGADPFANINDAAALAAAEARMGGVDI